MDRLWNSLCMLLVLTGLSNHFADGQAVIEVGCYRVASGDFVRSGSPIATEGVVTPASCVKACASSTNGFALVGNGECRCSPSLHVPMSAVSNTACNKLCGTGPSRYNCGSTSDRNLYNVFSVPVGEVSETDLAYVGCFEESTPVDPRINQFEVQLDRNGMLHTQCMAHCQSRRLPFAAVSRKSASSSGSAFDLFGVFSNRYYCRCGNGYGSRRRAPNSKCPGSMVTQPCRMFECFITQFAESGFYSVFTTVQHPPSVAHCGNPSPGGAPRGSTKIGVDHYHGNSVRYECDADYHVIGSANTVKSKTIACMASGNWSSSPPTCVPVTCNRPADPQHASVTITGRLYGHMYVGAMITYQCPPPYQLVLNGMFHEGSASYDITCRDDGLWSGPTPQCRNETCLVPPPPDNGGILATSTRVKAGDSIFYKCDCGFVLEGSHERSCSNGILVPDEPQCRRLICQPRFSPVNGSISGNSSTTHYQGVWYPIWEAEEIAYYTCNNGSQLAGSSFAVCSTRGVWSHEPPTCQPEDPSVCTRGLASAAIEGTDNIARMTVAKGAQLRLRCGVTGNPPPSVSWTRLAGGAESDVDAGRAVHLADNSLFFLDFASEDTGKYQCTAENGIGAAATKVNVLKMSVAPHVVAASTSVFQQAGGRAVLRCSVVAGDPMPRITWHFRGRSSSPRWRQVGDITASELTVLNVTLSDSGKYECRATNEVGGQMVTNSSTIGLHIEQCPSGPSRQFIVGGSSIGVANASWQAVLWNTTGERNLQILCGAVIIKRRYVLTAAHCMYPITNDGKVSSQYVIKFGKDRARAHPDDPTRGILDVIIHPQYNPNTLDNDIAIIALDGDVMYTPGLINAIDLARPSSNDMCNELVQSRMMLTGFGRRGFFRSTGTRKLHYVELPVVSADTCARAFPTHPVTGNMICAGFGNGQKDACHGDSGGPAATYNFITRKWTLVGLISWGDRFCASHNTYTVLVRVSRYVEWIGMTIREHRMERDQCN